MIRGKVGVNDFKVGCYKLRFVSNYEKRSIGTFNTLTFFPFVFVRV